VSPLACGFCLVVQGVEAESQSDGHQHQSAHGDAQILDRRSDIGELP
jgi:hypothetical protein